MSDYIDKSNLYKSIVDREEEYRSALLKEENYNSATALQLQGLLNATTLIKHLVFDYPTVDAEPVVRCKDCKWHEDEEAGMVWCPNEIGNWVKDDWFCADGERREDETN